MIDQHLSQAEERIASIDDVSSASVEWVHEAPQRDLDTADEKPVAGVQIHYAGGSRMGR